MKRNLLLVIICLTYFSLQSQSNLNCYRISFSDKNQSTFSLSNPSQFLSMRAIEKRNRFQIALTEEDLPINTSYIQRVLSTDGSMVLLTKSKWNNSIVIYSPYEAWKDSVSQLSFVSDITAIAEYESLIPRKDNNFIFSDENCNIFNELKHENNNQLAFHKGDKLHNLGFRGEGMLIAVLDAGWTSFQNLTHLSELFVNNQIVGVRDLQPQSDNVYMGNFHGTAVTSIMAANIDDELIGSAPGADYFFIRCENPWSEQWIEEDFWAEAAEIADSIGADVINSSLGYTNFDNIIPPFSYANADGESSIASRAATKAAERGIVVCIAAGNSGDSDWHYIARPADAKNILAVGATNLDSLPAYFTSVGPSYDGRIKPDVASVGWNTSFLNSDDSVRQGNGTSFASPIIAGLAACLWQGLPQQSSLELMQIIREASHQYETPDTLMGYGIPNFYRAYRENRPNKIESLTEEDNCYVFPNPCSDKLGIYVPFTSEKVLFSLFDLQGKLIKKSEKSNFSTFYEIDTRNLQKGIYLLYIQSETTEKQPFLVVKKVVKL